MRSWGWMKLGTYKTHLLNMLSAKWCPFCLGLHVLIQNSISGWGLEYFPWNMQRALLCFFVVFILLVLCEYMQLLCLYPYSLGLLHWHCGNLTIDRFHISQNAPVPYPTLFHSEQKCAHFCSEWSIVGYGTGAFWDLWIRSIAPVPVKQPWMIWIIMDTLVTDNIRPVYQSTTKQYAYLWSIKEHFVYASSQWETMLQSNVIIHWLGEYTKSSLG